MFKRIISSAAIASLMLASTAANADTRPVPTAFAIMVNDDFVEAEPVGWLWAGVGVLAGLGILILMSGKGNGRGNSPT